MNLPDPVVQVSGAVDVASDVLVIPNDHVGLVPNIGLISGTEAVLVVDAGLGVANAAAVAEFASEVARGRRIYLTTTHFHPEHAFGASVFDGSYVVNRAQAEDLRRKGTGYLEMFRGFGGAIAERLAETEVPVPDEVFDGVHALDLGGRTVVLRPTGRGHTSGDQVIEVPRYTVAEDFSQFANRVPGFYFFVGATPADHDPATAPANHSPQFFLDETALAVGRRAMLAVALEALRAE